MRPNNNLERFCDSIKLGTALAGLIYDDAGNRMVASHARKKDTIYRYYTSVHLMRGSKRTAGSISRVSAPRIEGKIIEGLRSANIAPPGTSDAKLLHTITKIVLHAAEIELHLVDAHGNDRLIRIAADMRSAKTPSGSLAPMAPISEARR